MPSKPIEELTILERVEDAHELIVGVLQDILVTSDNTIPYTLSILLTLAAEAIDSARDEIFEQGLDEEATHDAD